MDSLFKSTVESPICFWDKIVRHLIFGGEINVEGWRPKYLLELKRFFKTKAINFCVLSILGDSFS